MTFKVCYSPDADDVFMFWALERGLIPSPHSFTFERHDTQTLNLLAKGGGPDICAVSAAAVPGLLAKYRLLPHGGSVGDNYGPVVVRLQKRGVAPVGVQGGAERPREHVLDDRRQDPERGIPATPPQPVAIPGEHTTAALVLRLLHQGIRTIEVPITPFAEAFQCLRDGRAQSSLLIHEGRLTYKQEGCELVEDIGVSWQARFGVPLPLGVNVIRRGLPDALQRELEKLLRASLTWAKLNRDKVIEGILKEKLGNLHSKEALSAYLDLYANEETQSYSQGALQGLRKLFTEGAKAGLLRDSVPESELDGSYWRSLRLT